MAAKVLCLNEAGYGHILVLLGYILSHVEFYFALVRNHARTLVTALVIRLIRTNQAVAPASRPFVIEIFSPYYVLFTRLDNMVLIFLLLVYFPLSLIDRNFLLFLLVLLFQFFMQQRSPIDLIIF